MIGRTNAGGSGGGLNKSVIIVTAPTGATVTCKSGTTTKTAAEKNGTWTFTGLDNGTWTITATKSGQTATKSVTITRLEVEYVTIAYNQIPEFTYTGDYEIVDDADTPITTSDGNWKIRFLTSGTLTFKELWGVESGIDVFLVGGGGSGGEGVWSSGMVQGDRRGGGGGSGYTATYKNVSVSIGSGYTISIGAGGGSASGPAGLKGGDTTAFGKTASGGEGTKEDSNGKSGGDGGSGGGNENYDGGSNGANGGGNGGTGQGTTTREFGAASGTLYATGGSGKSFHNGGANTGDGGSGGMYRETVRGGTGGSGIVIIRNKR